ncbi:MAG: hypothetical protein TREMPRED_000361 [Tremellales sp. Tagirdzhanova-0007]|nr:MAG: hypothetical protein TREMPRED_000361 [Tremellales sp. Tagirdzhanova-0007]
MIDPIDIDEQYFSSTVSTAVMIARQAVRQTICIPLLGKSRFSTSLSPLNASPSPPSAQGKGKGKALSSCPAGTSLAGLAILKNENDPIAKPDVEYPAWLWTILAEGKVSDLAKEPRQVMREGQEFDFERERKRLAAVCVAT